MVLSQCKKHQHMKTGTYADDTQTSVVGDDIERMKKDMEQDALQVMKFMTSNGLIANPTKIALLVLNHKFETGNELLPSSKCKTPWDHI